MSQRPFSCLNLATRIGLEPTISALTVPYLPSCSISLDTFLEHLVRRIPRTLCLKYCLVSPRAKKFGSKMAAKTDGIFRPFSSMSLST